MLRHWEFDRDAMRLRLLDQRKLPSETAWVACETWREAAQAIKDMVIRGAPAIGVTAAWACVMAAREAGARPGWREWLKKSLRELGEARPTAVNLAWAVKRMAAAIDSAESPERLQRIWFEEAERIAAEDEAACRMIGRWGRELVKDGDTVLTHCNAGALACAAYGTALGVVRAAVEEGKRVKVIADETRPFFQGARLTAYELKEDGIPVTVACDSACASLMERGGVQLVITGADRIARNGDAANKIGTFGAAIMARYFNIPFYIAAPLSTFDASLASGKEIPIEIRSGEEAAAAGGARITPDGVPFYNQAFDVTPAALITAIITEKGIIRPPYEESVAQLMAQAGKD